MKRRWVDDCGLRGVALCPANLKKKIMIDVPVRDIRDNLVFSTDFRNFVGNDIKDQSGNIADVTNSGAVRETGYGCGKSLSFDGSDDYCVQKVYDTQQGTVRIATVNGGAVLWDDGQDFTEFAGAAGSSKGYIAVVSDAEGEVAGGYIGEEGGGETLGSELITNGTVETGDTTGWISYFNAGNGAAGSMSATSVEKNNGTYSLQVNITDAGSTLNDIQIAGSNAFTLTIGNIYKITFAIKGSTTFNNARVVVIKASAPYTVYSDIYEFNITTSWVEHTHYFTALGNSDNDVRMVYYFGGIDTGDIYIDDSSLKKVTDFPANESIKLYSTKTGSTQNLAWNEASFDPNDTLTYEVRKSDFQVTGDLSCFAFVKYIANDWAGIISKYESTLNKRSFVLEFNDANKIVGFISDDGSNTINKVGTKDLLDGDYHFVGMTYSTSTYLRIFLDGKLDAEDTTSIYSSLYDSDTAFLLGARYNNGSLDGRLGGNITIVYFYDRILNIPEQTQLYNYLLRKLGSAQ